MPRSSYDYWDDFKPSHPRPADGIKAKSQRGSFGSTWWATRWIQALERLMDAGRLSRGRSYARGGQVLNLDIGAGRVAARVQGSRKTPYKIAVELTPLTDDQWSRAIDAMAEQAIFAAKLLNGEMPPDIEEAFKQANVALFPVSGSDLRTSCSCPDYANPCKHIAAVYLLLGERFDADPFLLFHLRGRSKEQIMAAMRALRAANAVAEEPAVYATETPVAPDGTPLAEQFAHFWTAGAGLADFRVTVAAPAVATALLKRLGPLPVDAGQNRSDTMTRLAATYDAVTQAALALAFSPGTA
jgi:uncharacterized Zn finger protein